MHDQPWNNSPESAPSRQRAAESETSMWNPTSSHASSLPPGPLGSASTAEKLARWDELTPTECDRLALDPALGPQLELLKRGEEWLLSGGQPQQHCPSPEALFEFAEAPGAEALAEPAQSQVASHLESCEDCAGLVAGLRSAQPPAHLLEGRPQTANLRLVSGGALAAAALALIAFVPRFLPSGQSVQAAWPQTQTLRGPEASALLSPGGNLLAESLGAPWSKSLLFRVEPVLRATNYTVRLRAHSGGAFEVGTLVLELESEEPEIATDQPLDPGHYTWEAWATIDGLMSQVGARDFTLDDSPQASSVAAAALRASGVERVRILHEARLYGDARRAAEALPSSDERDAYLSNGR